MRVSHWWRVRRARLLAFKDKRERKKVHYLPEGGSSGVAVGSLQASPKFSGSASVFGKRCVADRLPWFVYDRE